MTFSKRWYWMILVVFLIMGFMGCRDFPTEPISSTPEDTPTSPDLSPTSDVPSDGSQDGGDGTEEEGDSGDDTGYCDGSELLCLPEMTSEYVAKYNGDLVGGTLRDGEFTPSSTGGIEFPLSIDTSSIAQN